MPDAVNAPPAGGQEPVLDFVVVRPPSAVPAELLHRRYIHDDTLVFRDQDVIARIPCDLHTTAPTASSVGRLVHRAVYGCADDGTTGADRLTEAQRLDALYAAVLAGLPKYAKPCAPGGVTTNGTALTPYPFEALDRYTRVWHRGCEHILTERLEQLTHVPLVRSLLSAQPLLERERSSLDPARLTAALETLFAHKPLRTVVFAADGSHTTVFRSAKRELFDNLYRLYILRRIAPTLTMEHLIDGLRTLHLLEALATDQLVAAVSAPASPSRAERALLSGLAATTHPELRGWDLRGRPPGFPLIADTADLAAYRAASPVVHPVFARLFRYPKPFNDIRPIGVGDLKVVRQWLTAYVPGEISHIHNVLKGERKTRLHRRTERTEETFSFSGTAGTESSKDSQTTQRFEVKKEAEQVVKTTLGVTANANLSYNGGCVVASIGAGFSYNRSADDTAKSAQNFARETVAKAVERVTSQTVTQRATTMQFETEERNLQQFTNAPGTGHVSGMYRWVDKQYTAQVFTYGKRLMFEFLVPQPAEFWVWSRLRSYSDQLDLPMPPGPEPVRPPARLDFTWSEVDKRYADLTTRYDLRHLPRPDPVRKSVVRHIDTRESVFTEKDVPADPPEPSFVYNCQVEGGKGYRVVRAVLNGYWTFHDTGSKEDDQQNGATILLDHRLVGETRDYREDWQGEYWNTATLEEIVLSSDDTPMHVRFHGKLKKFKFRLDLVLEPAPATLDTWRHAVYDTVLAAEQKKLDERHERDVIAHEAARAQYSDRMDQLKATSIGALLQAGASGAHRDVMDEEIKKHCLTLITKEFDEDDSDDLLQGTEAMSQRSTTVHRTWFDVGTVEDEKTHKVHVKAGFTTSAQEEGCYPAIDIDVAREKGRLAQFLEQAFEWHHISYLFYPYFWARMPRWIELMNRADDADPDFTAFLRAGMARVLVAVTPAYEDAVLHYLATREPWTGGPAPVIGDPLFLPLHEEVRKQTDDRLGGRPEGDPWTYTVPTSLVYLHQSEDELPDLVAERKKRGWSQ
jgi:hypothetical protein